MEKLDGLSMNIEQVELDKLASLFPQCFVEGKLVLDKLLALLGEYDTKDFERYEFIWKGKSECLPLAQKRSSGTLRPCPEESVDFENTQNLYIEGDNLEVLKLLQTPYYRQIKMIYIDPPYNTGNDFVYEDDFADTLAKYKEVTSQATKSNPESMGRFHTNWLNMMYPRLRLAANLLRDDGVIFISIDDGEQGNLKKLCDEIFGEENFVEQIIWQKRTSPDARKKISAGHEYILIYAKKLNALWETLNLLDLSAKDIEKYKNPDNDPRGPWTSTDFTAQGYRPNQIYKIITPGGAEYTPKAGHCWKNIESLYLQQISEGRFWFGADGKGVPRRKTYLSEREGKNVWTWWPNNEVGHTQEATQEIKNIFGVDAAMFDFSKPSRLIRRILQLATSKSNSDIVLDFFSGSATTAHAVMQLNAEDSGNRRFIMVQLPELCDENSQAFKAGYKNICEIGKERIRRTGAKLQESQEKEPAKQDDQLSLMGTSNKDDAVVSSPLDTGFKVFKLDTSNLKSWDSSPIPDDSLLSYANRFNDMIDRVKADRTDLDMVYEIMLKMGVPLTEPVTPISISDKTAYSVGADCLLLICLVAGLTVELIEEMAEYAPAKIIVAENSLADDSAMSNAHYILRDRGIELKLV